MARFKPYLFKRALKKYRFLIFIWFLLTIFLFLLYLKLEHSTEKQQAITYNKLFWNTDFKSCKAIINLNEADLEKNKYIDIKKFLESKQKCLEEFDIANISFNKDVCSLVVQSKNIEDLSKYFLKLNDFDKVKNKCISKYLNLKFSDKKWLNKNILFDVKSPINVRYKDKFDIDLSIFNNLGKKADLTIKYSSEKLSLTWALNLVVDPKSLKNISILLQNNKKSWNIDLKIDFLEKWKIIETQNLSINILNTPYIWYRNYKYWKTTFNNPFIDLDFDIWNDVDKKNSQVQVEFYNNSLIKIKDVYTSLEKNKIENSFYNLVLLNSTLNLLQLKDSDLEKIGFDRKKLEKKVDNLVKNFEDYRIDTWMFSLRKNTNVADFILTAYIYVTLNKLNSDEYDLENTKKNLYYYINDDSISLWNRLTVMMILSEIDPKIDLRFIDHNSVNSKHDLIVYTYALFKTGPVINDDLIKINIAKIKNLLKTESKKSSYYSNFSDELIFLNFLIDYDYYNKAYLINLFDDIYSFDFDKFYSSFLDKGLSIRALTKKYLSYEDNDKTKYWFMLGLARNTDKVFWIWWILKPFEIFEYNLANLLAYGDKKLEFRTKKLLGKDFKVNLILNWEYKNLEDNVKNNKNVEIYREIYKKDKKTGKFLNYSWKELKVGEQYKIIDKIIFIDRRPRKNIVVKDYLPANFDFFQIIGEDNKYNSFYKNNNYLEFQFANYWWEKIEISYLVENKNKWEFLDPWIETYMMFNDDMYGRSKNTMIKTK